MRAIAAMLTQDATFAAELIGPGTLSSGIIRCMCVASASNPRPDDNDPWQRVDSPPDDAHPDVVNEHVWRTDGLTISVSSSRCHAGGWCQPHEGHSFGIALPRRGAWRRRADGVGQFVDPSTGFFRRVGEVTEVSHFAEQLHTGTIIDMDPDAAPSPIADVGGASGPFLVTPEVDLTHQLLIAGLRAPIVDIVVVQERMLSLVSAALSQRHPPISSPTRRATATSRRRVVSNVCEHLHQSQSVSLLELGRAANYSPFHVSRVFREVTGMTISTYRTQLRVHDALARLNAGADDLAELAMETGFADHSHMTRTLVTHLGATPSAIRKLLREAAA